MFRESLALFLSFNICLFNRDMVKLKDGMGDKLSVVAYLIGSAIFSLVQVFPLGWELSLACTTLVPFSIAATIALTKVSIKKNKQKTLSSKNKLY